MTVETMKVKKIDYDKADAVKEEQFPTTKLSWAGKKIRYF